MFYLKSLYDKLFVKTFQGFPNLPVIRAHLCTLAISVSCNATWRLPRDAFTYGGLTYGLVLTTALVLIALPLTLLQLAIGQLSEQDAIGVWRAVPFFKGKIKKIFISVIVFGSLC